MPPKPIRSARTEFTHFLAIPLATPSSLPTLSASLARFAADATAASGPGHSAQDPSSYPTTNFAAARPPRRSGDGNEAKTPQRIPPKAIRPATTLHLTLGMMSLKDASRLEAVGDFLKRLDLHELLLVAQRQATPAPAPKEAPLADEAAEAPAQERGSGAGDAGGGSPGPESDPAAAFAVPPLYVALRGLHSMQPAVTAASVLYAEPEDATGRLRPFCLALRDAFLEAGFVLPEQRELKLHGTIVNMVYARERGGYGSRRPRGGAGKIDASGWVEKYRHETWAEVKLDKVAVYEMGAKPDEEGVVRYKEVFGVDVPYDST